MYFINNINIMKTYSLMAPLRGTPPPDLKTLPPPTRFSLSVAAGCNVCKVFLVLSCYT